MMKKRKTGRIVCLLLVFTLIMTQSTAFVSAEVYSNNNKLQTTSPDDALVTSPSNGDEATDIMMFALKAIANKGIGSTAAWATSSLYKLIFGAEESDAEKLSKRIDEINENLGKIDEKLTEIENRLKEMGKQQEVIAIENDLQSARTAAKQLTTFVQHAKKSAIFKENSTEEEKILAYEDLNETFSNAYNETNILAHYLFDKDNIHTHKSLFYNTRWLSDSQNFLWDTWEIQYANELNARFTSTYLDSCTILYGMFSCLKDQAAKGEYKKADYQTKIDVTIENAGYVYKEWEANARPKNGYGTITFNSGDGQSLVFSNKLRAIGPKTGINSWKYPSGVSKSNMNKTTLDNMMYAKEKLDDGKTVYALSADSYQKFGKIIASLIEKGKIKKVPIYQWLQEAGFDMGASSYDPTKYSPGYASYPHTGKVLSPDEAETNVHYITDNDLRYWKTTDAIQEMINMALNVMSMSFNDEDVSVKGGFFASNLILLLTPDASLGNTTSPYTMEGTTLSEDKAPLTSNGTESYKKNRLYTSWKYTQSGNLVFESDIKLSSKNIFALDGKKLSQKAYYVNEKKQYLVIKKDYLDTIKTGKHVVHQITMNAEVAQGIFSVKDAPLDKAPKIAKAKAGKKAFAVKWTAPKKRIIKSLDGYKIKYSKNSSFASSKTVTVNAKATKKTIKKLKKGTYYVKMRKYVRFAGKNYYSPWSKTLRVKAK